MTRRQPFLPSCTYPLRAPGTPLAVRYFSTELAPDMEEEEEEEEDMKMRGRYFTELNRWMALSLILTLTLIQTTSPKRTQIQTLLC